MLTKIDEIYDLCIQVLSPLDRLRLAALILNDLVKENTICRDDELIEDRGLYNAMMQVKDETPLSLEQALVELEKE
jgi:hypothetical protein